MIGLYPVEDEEDVYLIELIINDAPSNVDASMIVQKDPRFDEDDWQAAYDEHYLNSDGTKIIGDFINQKTLNTPNTRMVFYMYLESFDIPLSTQYGELEFIDPTELPSRLEKILSYEPID